MHYQRLASLTRLPAGKEMEGCTVDMDDFSSAPRFLFVPPSVIGPI